MSTGAQAIRNIAFVGHPSSGKTTLVDALAHVTGASPRKGRVEDGSSICDTEPEEHEKKHTLQLAAVASSHGEKHWTFLDTPGYPDFVAETFGAMFAADLVVGVVSVASGATFNLRQKMQMAKDMGRARAIVLTHLDGENADFDTAVIALREAIGEQCVPVCLPDQSGHGFSAVSETRATAKSEWRQRLLDRVMDACDDEALLLEYLESQTLTDEQFEKLIPHAIQSGALIPLLVCNPSSGLGVENVQHFLARYAPCPLEFEVRDAAGEIIAQDPSGQLVGTVFNVKSDPHVGKVCLARIWAGTLKLSDTVHGEGTSKPEKLGGLFHLVGKKRETIEEAGPGSIVGFSKVEHIQWGESFTTSTHEPRKMAVPKLPAPMVALAVAPKSRADEQKIGEALHKLTAEDPTFVVHSDAVTHELVAHGMSDMHLQVIESRLKRRYGVEIDTKLPRIAYRETITKSAEGHHRHRKQSGGRGQFGECYMRLRPLPTGEGVQFKDAVVGGSIPRNLIPAVEKGIKEASGEGILTHSVVVDLEAEVYDGKFHAVDSDEMSFKVAGNRAFREGFMKAGPVLLEPVMRLEIRVPTTAAGTVFSDITSHRRGHVVDQRTEEGGAVTVVEAEVPLSTVQTYHRDLKSQTAGEGNYTMAFSTYARVPAPEQERILREFGRKREEE